MRRFKWTLQLLRLYVSDNGLGWTLCFLARVVLRHLVEALNRHMSNLEEKRELPGEHSVAVNSLVWQTYNWEQGGEEWTWTSKWKQSLVDNVMLKYIEPGKTVLEIGPGAGRWTVVLQGIAKHLILVDLSQKCINLCKKRFTECDNIEFYVNDGSSLGFIPDETVDYVWSFDVFVHINPRETDIYLTELSRVLTKGGRGIIHHAKEGGRHGAWRSHMTSALFCELLEKHGLTLVAQFDSWGDVERDHVGFYDAITVFEKCVPNCSVSEIIGQHGGLE